jgi:acetolactate synthase-1/2/3 large subunit
VISGAEDELRRLAETLNAPVATTISGQGSISEDHALSLGVVGSNGGTPQTREVVNRSDVVVFVGCRAGSVTTERWRHPNPKRTKLVHIDADPSVIGANYATDVALAGDAKLALSALVAELSGHKVAAEDPRGAIAAAKHAKFEIFSRLAGTRDGLIKPESVIAALQQTLPDDAIIVADPGTPCPYFSAYFEFKGTGRRFITNRAHGALGYSLSASIGAQLGCPGRKTISVMGDGSFGFAVGELETVVRLKLPITFIVFSNDVYGWIKAGQRAGFDRRYFSVDFSHTEHAQVATAYGLASYRVTDASQLRKVLGEAIGQAGPSFVEIISQPLHEANAPVSEWVA